MFIDNTYQNGQNNLPEDEEERPHTNRVYILDLLKNRMLDEVLKQENFNILIESFNTLYLPTQIFDLSNTKERINRLNSLSYFEYYKFIKLYEMIVMYGYFDRLYYLETDDNENLIAEKIIDFDEDYWASQNSCDGEYAYGNMINSFTNTYSINKVRELLL
jgi:hypothetical protein